MAMLHYGLLPSLHSYPYCIHSERPLLHAVVASSVVKTHAVRDERLHSQALLPFKFWSCKQKAAGACLHMARPES